MYASRIGLEAVRPFADEIGASAVDTRGAVEGVDLIVISIPFPAVAELPKDLFDAVPQDVPVIDSGNYYPGLRDPHIPEIDAGMPHSLWVAKQLGRPVNEPTAAAMGGAPMGYDATAYARDVRVFRPFLERTAPDILFLGPGSVGEGNSLSLSPSAKQQLHSI